MTNATVRPIHPPHAAQPSGGPDDFVELLGVLADLAVRVHNQREHLEAIAANGDDRARSACEHLAALERHAGELRAEAATVRNELQCAKLI